MKLLAYAVSKGEGTLIDYGVTSPDNVALLFEPFVPEGYTVTFAVADDETEDTGR